MHSRIDIIITDDQRLLRNALVTVLKEFNIQTIGEAENGIELLQLVETLTPDIILLDLEMPLMDGGKVGDILFEERPDLKIIILSYHDEEALKENFLLRGAKSFLTKDMEIKVIADEIRRIHDLKFSNSFSSSQNFLFTKRELEIIPLICTGKSTKEIASILNLEIKTIEAHRKRIYSKTGATCIGEFFKIVYEKGFHFLKIALIFFIL